MKKRRRGQEEEEGKGAGSNNDWPRRRAQPTVAATSLLTLVLAAITAAPAAAASSSSSSSPSCSATVLDLRANGAPCAPAAACYVDSASPALSWSLAFAPLPLLPAAQRAFRVVASSSAAKLRAASYDLFDSGLVNSSATLGAAPSLSWTRAVRRARRRRARPSAS